jgi:lipoyl(octanoyl) transferase
VISRLTYKESSWLRMLAFDRVPNRLKGPTVKPMRECQVIDVGQQQYEDSLAIQEKIVQLRKSDQLPDCLLFVRYLHTITLGRSGKTNHLLVSKQELAKRGVGFYSTDRGGDITYHGPGQLIAYPVLDLKCYRRDIDWYLRGLERCLIQVLASFGISASRVVGATGVWVGDQKIAAIGVRTSQWVTSHGVALNVNPDLTFFDLIVPCGLANRGVTSMAQVLRVEEIDLSEVRSRFCEEFGRVFDVTLRSEGIEISSSADDLLTVPTG